MWGRCFICYGAAKLVAGMANLTKIKIKRPVSREPESTKEMTALIRQACLVARDAAANTSEFIGNSSKMAFLAVKKLLPSFLD